MTRPRKHGNRDLPPNLYREGTGFRYRHPLTGKRYYWQVPRARAVDAAHQLNSVLVRASRTLVDQVITPSEAIADALRVFLRDDIPSRHWSKHTARENGFKLRKIEHDIGTRRLAEFGVRDCAEYLQSVTQSPRARQQYRNLLILIFDCAMQQGFLENNPARVAKVPAAPRQRERLTAEGYRRVYTVAEPWLQNAMELSLHTLLRREDVAYLRFSDVHDGCIYVVPEKTATTTHVKLCIRMSGPVAALISRCRDDVVSPFVIHRLPKKARPKYQRAAEREHHTQVLVDQLTRAFADARDAVGGFGPHPPTFHEIRSLGASLYRQQGWKRAQLKDLMGHASAAMTRAYLAGHDTPWTEVSAGLVFQ